MSEAFFIQDLRRRASLQDDEEDFGCVWCCEPSPLINVCPGCSLVHYCSLEHLSNHYDGQVCLPFKIKFARARGRYAIATREIDATELIMRDEPLVVGPSRQQKIVCVECLRPVDGCVTCSDCNLPLCQPNCARDSAKQWHNSLECPKLKELGFRASSKSAKASKNSSTDVQPLLVEIASISPFRLLLKGLAGEKCHQDLVQPPLYNFYAPAQSTTRITTFEADMVDTIWNRFNLKACLDDKSVVRKAIGQLFNNAKSLEKPGYDGSGIYGRYCMLNHACVSNAKCVVGKAEQGLLLDVRAQTIILKGEEITTRYIGVNVGSPGRSTMLQEHWSFTCTCKRCMDPEELGSFASAVICSKCKEFDFETNKTGGLLLPSGKIPADAANWACTTCDNVVTKASVENLIEACLRIIRNNTTDPPEVKLLEHVIQELETVFHPRHYLILQVRFVLLRMMASRPPDPDPETNFEWAQLIIALCLELLGSLNVLDPGASRNRGKILKELIKPFMFVAEADRKSGILDEKQFAHSKRGCAAFAKDLVLCYKYEFF